MAVMSDSKFKLSKFTHVFTLSCNTSNAEVKLSNINLEVTGLLLAYVC